MIIIDSSGWLEYFKGGRLSDLYDEYISRLPDIIVPTIVVYEVYKKLRTSEDYDSAINALTLLYYGHITPVWGSTAVTAAEISKSKKLAMADAVIYATARLNGAELVTSDKDFEGLDGVVYIA